MQTVQRRVLAGLVERIVDCRVPVASRLSPSPSRSATSGVSAREYVLRRVASPSVELPCVALPCVEPVHRVSLASHDRHNPRLELAHVFACLKARAIKSKVSRLLDRMNRKLPRRVPSVCASRVAVTSRPVGKQSMPVPRLSNVRLSQQFGSAESVSSGGHVRLTAQSPSSAPATRNCLH